MIAQKTLDTTSIAGILAINLAVDPGGIYVSSYPRHRHIFTVCACQNNFPFESTVIPKVGADIPEVCNEQSGPRGKSIFSAGFRELTDTRLGKEESAAADRML
jgi:hypothetical protein